MISRRGARGGGCGGIDSDSVIVAALIDGHLGCSVAGEVFDVSCRHDSRLVVSLFELLLLWDEIQCAD